MDYVADSVSPLALELVLAHSWNPIAYQILNPEIRHWFSRAVDAVIGQVPCNRVRVAAGAPICRPTIVRQVAEEFEDDAARFREKLVLISCRTALCKRHQRVAAALDRLYRIDAYWNPMGWNSILHSDASIRYQIARARPDV